MYQDMCYVHVAVIKFLNLQEAVILSKRSVPVNGLIDLPGPKGCVCCTRMFRGYY